MLSGQILEDHRVRRKNRVDIYEEILGIFEFPSGRLNKNLGTEERMVA